MTNRDDMTSTELRTLASTLHERANAVQFERATMHPFDAVIDWRMRTETAMLRSQARELTQLADFRETDPAPVGLGEQAMTREMGSTPVDESDDICAHSGGWSSDCGQCQRDRAAAREQADDDGMADVESGLVDRIAGTIVFDATGRPASEQVGSPRWTQALRTATDVIGLVREEARRDIAEQRRRANAAQQSTAHQMRHDLAQVLDIDDVAGPRPWSHLLEIVRDREAHRAAQRRD